MGTKSRSMELPGSANYDTTHQFNAMVSDMANASGYATLLNQIRAWLYSDRVFTAVGLQRVANTKVGWANAFHFQIGASAAAVNVLKLKAADTSTGVAPATGTVPADKWGAWLYETNAGGTVTSIAAAGNTTGYTTEALAKAAVPGADSNNAPIGYVTILTATGLAFVPGTDALQGGTGGNPATTTNYYDAGLVFGSSPVGAPVTGSTTAVTVTDGSDVAI